MRCPMTRREVLKSALAAFFAPLGLVFGLDPKCMYPDVKVTDFREGASVEVVEYIGWDYGMPGYDHTTKATGIKHPDGTIEIIKMESWPNNSGGSFKPL